MSGINVGRVIVGGLAAGFVANVFDFIITSYLLANELAGTIARLNLNAAAIESSVWAFVIVDFIWGLLLVFTYAAIRPRFGPGPKTAIISGVPVAEDGDTTSRALRNCVISLCTRGALDNAARRR
jgi:hypothetical protein